MAVLSGEQIAQLAYQAGFRGEDLVRITAIAKRESGYKSDAHRTDNPGQQRTGDFGLWQINYTNLGALRAIGITDTTQLFDPLTNARAAFYLYQQAGGLGPWSVGPGDWTANGNPLYGVNVEAARGFVNSASQKGMLGQDFAGAGVTASGAMPTAGGQQNQSGPVKLPKDAKIYVTPGFTKDGSYVWAVFDVGGVKLAYNVMAGESDWKSFNATTVSGEEFSAMGIVFAGDVGELGTVSESFGSYREFWDSILAQVMGTFNPARNDPEVLRVLAEFAARPDMSETELMRKLEATSWYQKRSEAELEWNGLSAAEQDKRRQEAAARAVDTWFQYTGQQLDPNDPRIKNYVEQLASGKIGWGAFSQIVKDQALDIAESPYAREVRAAEEAARERPITIENTAQNIRDQLNRWGLKWTNAEIMRWAKQIVEKVSSDQDLMQAMKTQAAQLYPWKDPELETLQAAQPWLETYERVMEKTGSLGDAKIRKALTAGQTAWDFEQDLKKSSGWLETRNAREELTQQMYNTSKMMGFVA